MADARRECADALEEIASKQQRRHRNRVVLIPTPRASAEVEAEASESPLKDADTTIRRSARRREKELLQPQKSAESSDRAMPQPVLASEPLTAVNSVIGFTNVGNTCYFNAATQALLTVAHYFPEHMHSSEALETPDCPVLGTFRSVSVSVGRSVGRSVAGTGTSEAECRSLSLCASVCCTRRSRRRRDGDL